MSQCRQVLKHLKRADITSMEAFHSYKITRLAARIADLRESGYNIVTTMKTQGNKTFAVYSLNGHGTG